MPPAGKFPLLAKPVKIGAIQAKSSMFMSSLTRNRWIYGRVNDAVLKYYAQRARDGGAGLIFSEGVLISPQGTEWPHAPGIWDEAHAADWKKVTDACHKEGTPIVAQLWHVGRVAHPDMPEHKKAGTPVWGPSAITARGGKFRLLPGSPGYVTPTEIPDPTTVLDEYTNAAKMAKLAGFDGVEFHSANGYLSEQFLSDISNKRTDKWGGSVENRCRFCIEGVKRLVEVWGADRVGVKLTPAGGYNDSYYSSTEVLLETFHYLISQLDSLGVAWLQVAQYGAATDPKHDGVPQGYDHDVVKEYGKDVKHAALVVNCGYVPETAEKALEEGTVKAVAFGQLFIANPDAGARAQQGAEYNAPDYVRYYSFDDGNLGGGYVDYPFLDGTVE